MVVRIVNYDYIRESRERFFDNLYLCWSQKKILEMCESSSALRVYNWSVECSLSANSGVLPITNISGKALDLFGYGQMSS